MREVLIIVEREFRERVQTRSFVIGTLLFPVFMIGVMMMSSVAGDAGEQRRIALVDRAPAGLSGVFEQALLASGRAPGPTADGDPAPAGSGAAAAPEDTPPYAIERHGADALIEGLDRRVLEQELDGYVILPADILESGEVVYRARNITNRFVLRDISTAATFALQTRRLGSAGVDPATVRRLMQPVDLNTARVTEAGQAGGDAESTFWVAYILAFLAYFVIAMYGHGVMRSVIQEKVTRISEILVSTVRAAHLMTGKIAGVSGAALLQLAIWAAMVALVVSQSELLQERFGVSGTAVDAMRFEPGLMALLLAFFVLGFLLYAALFAALGAAMSSEQEAQPFQIVLMLPLFVPLLFLGAITNDPEGGITLALVLVPFTAPVAMPMRLAAAPADAGTVALSLALLVLAAAAVAWLAGKIYRVGILATGKRPTARELARWIRAA